METTKLNGSFYSLNVLIVWENELFNLPIILNEPNRGKRESFVYIMQILSSYWSKVKAQFTDEVYGGRS